MPANELEALAAMAPLMGTLSQSGILTSLQAMQEEEQRRLSEAAAQAAAQSQQAGQAYQQAAQAPPPDIGGAAFVPQLLGNIASVIGQNPAYAQRASQRVAGQQSDLMESRRNNLQALRDLYDQKAQAAEHLGNLDLAEKFRTSHERISNQLQKMQDEENQRQASELIRQRGEQDRQTEGLRSRNTLAEIAARGAQDRLTLKEKPKASSADRAASLRQGVDPDTGLLLAPVATKFITDRMKLAKKGDEKSRFEAMNGIQEIQVQRWSTDTDEGKMGRRLLSWRDPFSGQTPKDAKYGVTGEKVYRRMKVKGGKPQWVVDPDAELRAKKAINQIVSPWFQGE